MHSGIFEFSNVYVSMVYVKGEEKLLQDVSLTKTSI